MKHEVTVIRGLVYVPPNYRTQRIERWWSCTCGRVGPGVADESRTDASIIIGGRTHATRAANRAARRSP